MELNDYPQCQLYGWKIGKDGIVINVPNNVLWYFSHISHFRIIFYSREIVMNLTCHAN